MKTRRILAAMLVVAIAAAVIPATSADLLAQTAQVPQPQEGGVNWPGAGYGAAALFGNVLYIPAKLVYAILGGLVGGGAWLITAGNTQTANTIWRSSLGGDYVLTPQMVAGDQPINFSGPTDTSPTPTSSVAPINPPATTSSVQPIPPSSPGSSSGGWNAPGTSHPIDSGSGPVGGPAPALPNTSVE